MSYLAPFPSYRFLLVKLLLYTGVSLFSSIVRHEPQSVDCEIWPKNYKH